MTPLRKSRRILMKRLRTWKLTPNLLMNALTKFKAVRKKVRKTLMNVTKKFFI